MQFSCFAVLFAVGLVCWGSCLPALLGISGGTGLQVNRGRPEQVVKAPWDFQLHAGHLIYFRAPYGTYRWNLWARPTLGRVVVTFGVAERRRN